jgi:hypothetical protein
MCNKTKNHFTIIGHLYSNSPERRKNFPRKAYFNLSLTIYHALCQENDAINLLNLPGILPI